MKKKTTRSNFIFVTGRKFCDQTEMLEIVLPSRLISSDLIDLSSWKLTEAISIFICLLFCLFPHGAHRFAKISNKNAVSILFMLKEFRRRWEGKWEGESKKKKEALCHFNVILLTVFLWIYFLRTRTNDIYRRRRKKLRKKKNWDKRSIHHDWCTPKYINVEMFLFSFQ